MISETATPLNSAQEGLKALVEWPVTFPTGTREASWANFISCTNHRELVWLVGLLWGLTKVRNKLSHPSCRSSSTLVKYRGSNLTKHKCSFSNASTSMGIPTWAGLSCLISISGTKITLSCRILHLDGAMDNLAMSSALLAEVMARRKQTFNVKNFNEQVSTGTKGSFLRKSKTTPTSHWGQSFFKGGLVLNTPFSNLPIKGFEPSGWPSTDSW